MANRLKDFFNETAKPALMKRLELSNELQVPKLMKIVVNRAVNTEESKNGTLMDDLTADIANLTGQKPVIRLAKKSIAAFKLREGMPNGIIVTLRDDKMYAFLDQYISLASPRIRDFQGIDVKDDGHGNFTVGVKDQRIFVVLENRTSKGFKFTVVTTANNSTEGRALMEELGFPFVKKVVHNAPVLQTA